MLLVACKPCDPQSMGVCPAEHLQSPPALSPLPYQNVTTSTGYVMEKYRGSDSSRASRMFPQASAQGRDGPRGGEEPATRRTGACRLLLGYFVTCLGRMEGLMLLQDYYPSMINRRRLVRPAVILVEAPRDFTLGLARCNTRLSVESGHVGPGQARGVSILSLLYSYTKRGRSGLQGRDMAF